MSNFAYCRTNIHDDYRAHSESQPSVDGPLKTLVKHFIRILFSCKIDSLLLIGSISSDPIMQMQEHTIIFIEHTREKTCFSAVSTFSWLLYVLVFLAVYFSNCSSCEQYTVCTTVQHVLFLLSRILLILLVVLRLRAV